MRKHGRIRRRGKMQYSGMLVYVHGEALEPASTVALQAFFRVQSPLRTFDS